MLSRLAAEQGAASAHAAVGDAAHDGGYPLRLECAADHVVGHEERLGPADHEIVHHHGHEVDADGVVPAHPLGNRHLRADAIGGGGKQRPPVAGEPGRVEQPGEPADAAGNLWPGGAGD